MIYTASYFEPHRHHGQLFSISRSVPQGFRVDGRLEFFVPNANLLQDWKQKRINEEEYINRYREQIKTNFKAIKAWLSDLNPKKHITLLCWERSGVDETLKRWEETGQWKEEQPFCHRNLAIKVIQKFRPDCYGGRDILHVTMPVCQNCLSEVIPGSIIEGFDDAHYCPFMSNLDKRSLRTQICLKLG
ncbi:conserved hypothetical protein [Gloeothece citriformis PCC 7424]|uniref:DUF488 domain-containing protein n=1 Tax=Gloeothece citriformis (strain PCC 7424) TaxID=65393 RepID=B7KIY6_GLOC7|nr:hypothetical protein [Gloeothece citriformis]ACK70822.1 conserved hypothetical protein [Gloeothece citriformis PCC 7424]